MARNLNFLFKHGVPYIYYNLLRPKTSVQVLSRLRLYGSTATNTKVESSIPTYIKTDHEYRITKKATVQALVDLLDMKRLDALHLVLSNSYFQQVSKATLKSNYNLYTQNGILHETLFKNPELLTVLDPELKIKEVRKLPYEINEIARLILLSPMSLTRFVQSELKAGKAEGKINLLSSYLNISPQQVCTYLIQKPFLLNLYNEKIHTNLQVLLQYGIPRENICNDLWVLKYSAKLIQTRLNTAREKNVDTLKTWMVRVQEEAFKTHIRRCSDNKSILGDSSLAEYLSGKLECTVNLANYLILKQPALNNKNLKKLDELIDFLYAEGFKPHHICRVPKILVHSVETIRKRLKLFEEKNIKIDSLSILTKSQNQFMQNYEALVKSKNKPKTGT